MAATYDPVVFRPGTDEQNVQMSDVLCDFCHQAWTEAIPFVEGHRGCMICGDCLTRAYEQVVVRKQPNAPVS